MYETFYERQTEYACAIKQLMRLELQAQINLVETEHTVEQLLKLICDNVDEDMLGIVHPSRIAMQLCEELFRNEIKIDDIDWDWVLTSAQDPLL